LRYTRASWKEIISGYSQKRNYSAERSNRKYCRTDQQLQNLRQLDGFPAREGRQQFSTDQDACRMEGFKHHLGCGEASLQIPSYYLNADSFKMMAVSPGRFFVITGGNWSLCHN